MTSRQEARLNMLRAVEKHCDDNAAIVGSVPAFADAQKDFKDLIAALLTEVQSEDLVTSGITMGKAEAKAVLCQRAADTAAQVFAYASSTANSQLQQEVNFSISSLQRTKDDQLAPRCQNILDQATANITALAGFGVTAATLAALQSGITQYQAKVPSPRNASAKKKTTRKNIDTVLRAAEKLLKEQMDKTAVAFRADNPDFYNTYKHNRIIIDAAVTNTALSGTVKNAVDGTVMSNVLVAIEMDGEATNTATDNLGAYESKPAPAGEATVTFSIAGFGTETFTGFKITQGKNNVLDVALKQATL